METTELNVTTEAVEENAVPAGQEEQPAAETTETEVQEAAKESTPAAETPEESTPAAETAEAAEAADSQAESSKTSAPVESMKDYEKELEATLRKVHEGDILKGTVIDVDEEEITLDLENFTPGIIKTANYSEDPTFSPMEEINKGDVIEATVVRLDDGKGNIELSKKEANQRLSWDELAEDMKEERTLEVKVSESTKGGVVAFAKGIRGFIPASKLSSNYVEDLNSFVGKTVEVRVVDIDRKKNKLILSAREILREREAEARRHRIAMLAPGTVVEGTVETIQPYGAFVSLGDGLSGLVHISQISLRRISNPWEVLQTGQKVKVQILGTKDDKISLSMKTLEEKHVEQEEKEASAALKDFSSKEQAATSLGALLAGIKL